VRSFMKTYLLSPDARRLRAASGKPEIPAQLGPSRFYLAPTCTRSRPSRPGVALCAAGGVLPNFATGNGARRIPGAAGRIDQDTGGRQEFMRKNLRAAERHSSRPTSSEVTAQVRDWAREARAAARGYHPGMNAAQGHCPPGRGGALPGMPACAHEEIMPAAVEAFSVLGYDGVSRGTVNCPVGREPQPPLSRFRLQVQNLWRAVVDWAFGPLQGALEDRDDGVG